MAQQTFNFDRATEYYDATRGFPPGIPEKIAAFMQEKASLKQTDTMLELGIGTGRIALPLASHVGAIYGADISLGMMSILREKQTDEPVYPVQADAGYLPYPAGSFDAIVVVHVFHLLPNPEQAVRELQRVIKPDGVLLHGSTWRGEDGMKHIAEAWMQHTPPRRRKVNWDNVDNLLPSLGWEMIDDSIFKYTITQSPAEFLRMVEGRYWSTTWDLTDVQLAAGVAAIHQAINEHFGGNADTEVEQTVGFKVQLYRPPAS